MSGRAHDLVHLLALVEEARGDQRHRLLRELQEQMAAHFRAEEGEEGWFARAMRDAPELAERLAALEEEHLALAATAVELLREPDEDAEASFLAALRRHEEEEARLLGSLLRDR